MEDADIPSEANSTTVATVIPEDASRADLEWQELDGEFLSMSVND